MIEKEPVLLTILIDTARMRWLAGGIGFDMQVFPLLASQDNDLAGYLGTEFDEQASFLRHRFCGALQRGCDRLWGLHKKACQFVFLIDRDFPQASPELTARIAEHLVQWMTNPPVIFLIMETGSMAQQPIETKPIAGEMSAEYSQALNLGLPILLNAASNPGLWEQVPLPKPRAS